MWSRLQSVPPWLRFESALTLVVLLTGVVPFVLFTGTSVSAPTWFGTVWVLPVLSLSVLWLTLLCHGLVDLWRVAHGNWTAPPGVSAMVHAAFRVVETAGAVLVPVVPGILAASPDGSPLPPGFAVALVLFVAVPLVVSGAAVLAHAGWLLGHDRAA